MNVSEQVRKIREEKGLTREDLAELLNVSVGSVRNWETGVKGITHFYLEDMCKKLNVKIIIGE
jgi:DNA-binding transcriptional regulator YiaG